jgi:membrane fusion protein, multidrug efflux system
MTSVHRAWGLGILVALGIGLGGCRKSETPQGKKDSAPLPVKSAKVVMRDLQRDVESVGTLFPFEEVVISSEIEGRVVEVAADLGDRVTKDQVLVNVSDEEQRYLLAQNEAQLRMAMERLGLRNEKDRVTDIRETPEVRRAQADLTEAQQRLKRIRELTAQGIGSRQDQDQAENRFKAVQAAYDAVIHETRNLMQEVDRSRAVVDLQRKKLRDTAIRAPFAAQVKERQVNIGQYVRPNTPVFVLVKTDPVRLRIDVPERMAPWVKVGQFADVTLEAFTERRFKGKIWRISPTVDQSKRTFVVEALIDNPDGALKPGSYAKATIRTDKVDSIKLVPVNAVNYVFGANKIFIIRQNTIEAREVKLGDRFGADVEIAEGASEGEIVATTDVARLDSGVKVTVAN